MSDYICDQLKEAVNLLKGALQSDDREEIARLVEMVAKILKDLYAPLKDDYYSNLMCKDLYVEVRTLRESVIELLVGHEEHACADDCCCEGECKGDQASHGILSVLQDVGGDSECCDLGEVTSLLNEALYNVLHMRRLLCTCCSYDSCNLNTCSNDCDDSCDVSCSNGCNDSCSNSCDSSSSSCSSSSSSSCSSSSSSCSSCDSSSSSCDSCARC